MPTIARNGAGMRTRRAVRTRGPLVALCLAAALLFAFGAGTASAHASYVSSDPAANAVLKTAPSVVTIHFAEDVNLTGSDITVYNAKHQPVSGTAQVDRADLKTMTVPMTGDGSEIYLVVWHTVSLNDGDPDIGAFTFMVNPSATSASAAPATSAGSTGGTPIWVTIVIGIAGLILGAGAGLLLARRSRV